MRRRSGLEKQRGHLLNWYDTRTLSPLPGRYISTVDSGNLAASLLVAVMLFGVEAKGARRWISLAGMTLQPSEFMKPGLAIAGAWLFARDPTAWRVAWLLKTNPSTERR